MALFFPIGGRYSVCIWLCFYGFRKLVGFNLEACLAFGLVEGGLSCIVKVREGFLDMKVLLNRHSL